jgi:diguanylate cyclase (GGDEF)-like protein
MRQLVKNFSTIAELSEFLNQEQTRLAVDKARSVLAQIYVSNRDHLWMTELLQELAQLPEKVAVAGASCFAQICDGKAASGTNVVCLGFFDTASLVPMHFECESGQEAAVGGELARKLKGLSEPLKGVLLVTNPVSYNCDTLLTALHKSAPGIPLFGGGAGNVEFAHTIAFSRQGYSETAAIAVALCGGTLEITRRNYLGWIPVGKRMRVTKVDGFNVKMIDDKPAFDVYRRYLGITSGENLFFNAMEFPLLVKRHGEVLANVPSGLGEDNGVYFSAKINEGEEIQFGYADFHIILEHLHSTEAAIREFAPEAINIYSCAVRYFVMQQEVDRELAPFQKIANTAGFFTMGEFCDLGAHSPLFNTTLVVVGMRESAAPVHPVALAAPDDHQEFDIYANSHTRILLRFQHFMQAITEDLEAANLELANLAERDSLTGLFNRRVFESLLQAELERSIRYDRQFSLIMCDADYFKNLNDVYGHQAGDFVLQSLAAAIQKQARKADSVCRYGGEEFAILLPETGAETAEQFAERIRSDIEALALSFDAVPLPTLTMSFGIASFPHHAKSISHLFRAADKALYEAKKYGRNLVRIAVETQ